MGWTPSGNITGPTGPTGNTGSQGTQGIQGVQGPAGADATATTDASALTSGTLAFARLPVGTSSSTVTVGNDARLSDARTPTAHAHAGTDITSGTVPFARLPVGSTSTTITVGNDSRLSDARTPTSHVHSAADVTSGTLSSARLPVVLGTVVTTGNPVATSVTIDAAAGSVRDITCSTATLAVAVPTNGVNRQVLRCAFKHSTTAALTVNLNASIRLSTGLTSRAFSLASGGVLLCALEYSTLAGAWVLTAATTVPVS